MLLYNSKEIYCDNNYSYYFTGDGSDYLFTFDADNLTFRLDVIEPQPQTLLGDVDDDGEVGISDVSTFIDYLLGTDVAVFNIANADVDDDGQISISDVSLLIDVILNGV